MKPLLAIACTPLILAACTSTEDKLRNMYETSTSDLTGESGLAAMDPKIVKRQNKRIRRVNGYVEEGEVKNPRENLYAAYILVSSDNIEDLELAEKLALSAAERGENRGFRVAAEAIDRQAVKLGRPQRYGTQFVYQPVLTRWVLYDLDPRTTDGERKAMGVPTLSEIREQLDRLNETKELAILEEA